MKIPHDAPTEAGQRVELKGRKCFGELIRRLQPFEGHNFIWCIVAWDWECFDREKKEIPPFICSLTELRKLA